MRICKWDFLAFSCISKEGWDVCKPLKLCSKRFLWQYGWTNVQVVEQSIQWLILWFLFLLPSLLTCLLACMLDLMEIFLNTGIFLTCTWGMDTYEHITCFSSQGIHLWGQKYWKIMGSWLPLALNEHFYCFLVFLPIFCL